MSTMIRTRAIVLRRTNYGEADRVLQLLTPDHGKIAVIAKGVRREKSKLAGGIELFATCDVTIMNSKKGGMGTLTSARLTTFYRHIIDDYDRMQAGYEIIKQINKAAETVDETAFFTLLETSFDALDKHVDTRIVMAWFWLQLAILLGVGVNLSTDTRGVKLAADLRYDFHEIDSGFYEKQQGRFTSDHIKLLRLLSAQPPQVAAQVKEAGQLIDDCLWVAERAVHH